MEKKDISLKIYNIINSLTNEEKKKELTESSLLLDDHFFDSYLLIQLVHELDQQFSISIKTEDLNAQNFSTILSISQLIKGYLT